MKMIERVMREIMDAQTQFENETRFDKGDQRFVWNDAHVRMLAMAAVNGMSEVSGEVCSAMAEELEPYATQEKPWGQACERALDVWEAGVAAILAEA